ncbi:MAG: VOC family protein [Pseudomonadota bacterium]
MIRGINHVTLAVTELDRSIWFYGTVLGMRLVSNHEDGAYLEAGTLWLCLSVDPNVARHERLDYTHIAFDIDKEHFEEFAAKLKTNNVRVWKQNRSEGESVYFLDPDGHKLELHVGTLASRLEAMGAAGRSENESNKRVNQCSR